MEEKRRGRFFFSKGMKVLFTVLFLVSIGVFTMSVTLLSGLFQAGLDWEQITRKDTGYYEETNRCGLAVAQFLHRLPEAVENGKPFTTDGVLDLDKKVDITDLTKTEKKMNKNTTYTVGDIQKMVNEGFISSLDELLFGVKNNYDAMNGTYYGEVGSENRTEDAVETAEPTEESASDWQYSQLFVELYGSGRDMEMYLPQSQVSLADYAKENPETVSLMDLYQDLVDVGNKLQMYISSEEELGQESNVMYMVRNIDDGTVYTNLPAWKEGYDESVVKEIEPLLFFHALRTNGSLAVTDADSNAEKYLKNYYGITEITGKNEEIVIMLNTDYPITDEFSYTQTYYERYAHWGNVFLVMAIVSMILELVTLVLLTVQTGRVAGDKELHSGFADGVPTEVVFAAVIIPVALMLTINIEYISYGNIWDFFPVCLLVVGEIALGAVSLLMYQSLVRRIKGHRVWKSSLSYTIVQSCKKVYMARKTSGRMIIIFAILIFVNVFAVSLFSGFGMIVALIADGILLLYLIRESAGRQVIRDGLARIASGELDFKIDASELIGDNREMAEAVNHVGDGLQNAVKETLKSERLKADLITNVSHDIKTPLTSIINYVDLLKREDIQEPKIKGYIDILDSKSQRLKQLTEDLVEASKISSGNVILDMQPIRLGELIWQTNGEFEEKFAARNLELVCRIPEEPVVIMADGRRMWRVIENLYNNIAKYAMPNTRVYVEVKKIGCRVIFEVKNVSEYPLNIRAEELTERFIRGDVSRSTEGSGLGLSIAQNLVKLQQGTFDIYLDGDLFKVTITFEAAGK